MSEKEIIETLKKQIKKLVELSVQGILDLRKDRRAFYDDYHNPSAFRIKRTFIQTCEGLEIILQAAVTFKDNDILAKINNQSIKTSLKQDIDYLINEVEGEKYESFSGFPYYYSGRKHIADTNSTDALAFYAAVLTHLLLLNTKYDYNIDNLDDRYLRKHLLQCIDVIINSHNGLGWPFFIDEKKEIPDEYCTWSMLETIATLKEAYPEGFAKIIEAGILRKSEEWLMSLIKNGKIKDIQDFISSIHDDIDVGSAPIKSKARCFYDVAHILSSLALIGSQGNRKLGADVNFIILQTPSILEKEFGTNYPNGNNAEDYTLAPMLLKCLSFIFQEHFKKKKQDRDFQKGMGILAEQRDQVMLDIYSHIVKNKRNYDKISGKFNGFFSDARIDKWVNDDFKIDIYYTERVIESLVEFYDYLSDINVLHTFKDDIVNYLPNKTTIVLPKIKEKKVCFAKLPALDLYTTNLRTKYGNVFKNKIILCVQHFLSDLPPFVDFLAKLGADYRDIYLLQKAYEYPERNIVSNYLTEKKKCTVERLVGILSSELIDFKRKMLEKVLRKCKSSRNKLVIIEDGGYFVPLLPPKESKLYMGAVEQTTRGIRNDRKIPKAEISLPIIDVAKSNLKYELESPEVAQTLAQNIRYICTHNSIHWHITTVNILVLGCGAIGQKTTEILEDMGFNVFVHDKRKTKLKKLSSQWKDKKKKITALDKIEDVSTFDFILGLSGEQTITRDIILRCKDKAILASGSSETYEIDLKTIEESTKEPLINNVSKMKDIPISEYILKNNKAIRVLCNGEPINFQLSSGIPKVSIEPILMQLFWGAVRVCIEPPLKKGIVSFPKKIEDQIKNEFFGITQKR
jgi:S-adenosylhomocysteine hydrolase